MRSPQRTRIDPSVRVIKGSVPRLAIGSQPGGAAAPAHGFDHFAHDTRESFLVEVARRRPTIALGRPPVFPHFRHIDRKTQSKMGEAMVDGRCNL